MKVQIGKYTSWVGPYQIAENILFWKDKNEDPMVYNFGKWLSQDRHGNDSWLTKLCQWIESKKKRKVKIQIDPWDTWSMDNTLALIILPMLKQLKATNHGSPFVEVEDVPKHLRPKKKASAKNGYADSTHHERWEWVMDELIWTFTQLTDDNNDEQFHTGKIDMEFIPIEDGMSEMVKGPNDTHVFDEEAYKKHHERIKNGLVLFGKYYQGLWD